MVKIGEMGETNVGKIANTMEAAVTNGVLESILNEHLGLADNIVSGPNYQYAAIRRSTHRLGTVVEALVAAVMNDLGYEGCVRFVRRVWSAYLSDRGV